MNKKTSLFVSLSILASSSLYGVNTDDAFLTNPRIQEQHQQQVTDNEGRPIQQPRLDYPYETQADRLRFTNPIIQKDRFELGLNENFSRSVLDKKDRYSKIMTETIDTNLLIDSIVKQLKNTDSLYLHPHFLTMINFPIDTEIIYASSSINMDKFDFSQNLLILQPQKDFTNGNILVTFRDAEKTFYTNIIIQKYNQNIHKDDRYNRYVIDDNYLSLNYQYVRDIEFSPIKVLETYVKLNGDSILKSFKKDGYYDLILLSGVTFYVIKDSKFGTVDYKNMRFTISQQYDFGDKSILGTRVQSINNFYPSTEHKGSK